MTELSELKEKLKILKEVAIDVIKWEKLPVPKDIIFRYYLNGTLKKKGTCFLNRKSDTFKIVVNITKAKFVPSKDGTYVDRRTKQTFKRMLGELRKFNDIKETVAPEIAHLKFWSHGAQHKAYTDYVLECLNERLRKCF